jgi:hypothetical protein
MLVWSAVTVAYHMTYRVRADFTHPRYVMQMFKIIILKKYKVLEKV